MQEAHTHPRTHPISSPSHPNFNTLLTIILTVIPPTHPSHSPLSLPPILACTNPKGKFAFVCPWLALENCSLQSWIMAGKVQL